MNSATATILQRLRELCERATPGPWACAMTTEKDVWMVQTEDDDPRSFQGVAETGFDRPLDNARLIAAARNHLDALLDVAEAAQRCIQSGVDGEEGPWIEADPAGVPDLHAALARLDRSMGLGGV